MAKRSSIGRESSPAGSPKDARALALIRGEHTAIYVVMAASVFAILYAGITGAAGVWLWAALALIGFEIAVFAGSGMKCPLTAVAVKYGAVGENDTFFPERLTRHTFAFFAPLIVIGLVMVAARWCAALIT
jgi:hypothetical protein